MRLLSIAALVDALNAGPVGRTVVFAPSAHGGVLVAHPVDGKAWQVLWDDGRLDTAPIDSAPRLAVLRAVLDAIEAQIDNG